MAAEDLLVFVHIPKCAGTSIVHWIDASLPDHFGNLYVRTSDVPISALQWGDIDAAQLGNVELRTVASHHLRTYPVTAHGRRLRYVTILRDPVKRWISEYRYMRQMHTEAPKDASSWPHGLLPLDFLAMSPQEFVLWTLEQPPHLLLWPRPYQAVELIYPGLENLQTNFLVEHEWLRLRLGRHDRMMNWAAEPELFARFRSERLAFARETLRRFDVVGTVERLGEFLRLLRARSSGWDVPLAPADELARDNETTGPQLDFAWITPDDPAGGPLLAALADDFALYRYADAWLDAEVPAYRLR